MTAETKNRNDKMENEIIYRRFAKFLDMKVDLFN